MRLALTRTIEWTRMKFKSASLKNILHNYFLNLKHADSYVKRIYTACGDWIKGCGRCHQKFGNISQNSKLTFLSQQVCQNCNLPQCYILDGENIGSGNVCESRQNKNDMAMSKSVTILCPVPKEATENRLDPGLKHIRLFNLQYTSY